jgi:hypothetical protein
LGKISYGSLSGYLIDSYQDVRVELNELAQGPIGRPGQPWSVIILSVSPSLGLPRSGTAPAAMLSILFVLLATARDVLRPRADLVREVAALRQQLDVLERCTKRPKLRRGDRVFWI